MCVKHWPQGFISVLPCKPGFTGATPYTPALIGVKNEHQILQVWRWTPGFIGATPWTLGFIGMTLWTPSLIGVRLNSRFYRLTRSSKDINNSTFQSFISSDLQSCREPSKMQQNL